MDHGIHLRLPCFTAGLPSLLSSFTGRFLLLLFSPAFILWREEELAERFPPLGLSKRAPHVFEPRLSVLDGEGRRSALRLQALPEHF